ncbi:MAG TPA: hypothetical protein VMH02_08545 [Verrucomicrobiae bacterium]|nr:hypothetical protein [Verrucomicrobiae bacterium]
MRKFLAIVTILGLSACAAGATASNAPGAAQVVPQVAEASSSPTVPVLGGCQMFPAPAAKPTGESWFNVDISNYPLDPKSATYIAHLGGNLHPDFGIPQYGIPINIVPANQPKVPVTFLNYPSSSNPGPYPIPPNAQIEGEPPIVSYGDRHVLVLQEGVCKLYEMWEGVEIDHGKRWEAANGAVFNLKTGALRPAGWTSADAAGLPITPALINCQEVKAGAINHAVRVTFENTYAGYVLPATHEAGDPSKPYLPPMGERFRLKASFDISSYYTGQARIILTALKKYGFIVADNGSNWFFQGQGGTPAKCWNNNELNELKSVPGTAFEAVYTGPIHKGE